MKCATNIQTLRIEFAIEDSEREASEQLQSLIDKCLKKWKKTHETEEQPNEEQSNAPQISSELVSNTNGIETLETKEEMKPKVKKRKRLRFPSQIINPSNLPHLKNISHIDCKDCPLVHYSSFIAGLILQLSKFVTLSHLSLPYHCTIRHNCITHLNVKYLQLAFDGMNVHIGVNLIGITHFKKQLPRCMYIVCDELYLLIGEEVYIGNEKSGKQYWVVMNKWCTDTGIQVRFKNENSIGVMLMPRKKKDPPILCVDWEDIGEWMTDRLGAFLQPLVQ